MVSSRSRRVPFGKRVTVAGITYRSETEARVALQLPKGTRYEESKVPYSLNYIPDFQLPNGVILEVKGVLDAPDRGKMIAVKRSNPDLDIRFVFQHPTHRCIGLKSKCWEWAEKNGFPWCAADTIPSEWLK